MRGISVFCDKSTKTKYKVLKKSKYCRKSSSRQIYKVFLVRKKERQQGHSNVCIKHNLYYYPILEFLNLFPARYLEIFLNFCFTCSKCIKNSIFLQDIRYQTEMNVLYFYCIKRTKVQWIPTKRFQKIIFKRCKYIYACICKFLYILIIHFGLNFSSIMGGSDIRGKCSILLFDSLCR